MSAKKRSASTFETSGAEDLSVFSSSLSFSIPAATTASETTTTRTRMKNNNNNDNNDNNDDKNKEGGRSWIAVLGLFIVYFNIDTVIRAFGILFIALQNRFPDASKASIAALGGIYSALCFASAPLVAVLMNRGMTPRRILLGSGLMAGLGAALTAYVDVFGALYFTFGILLGVALGLAYTASLIAVGRRFDRRRPLALGLAYFGSPIAGFVMAPLLTLTAEELGFRGTLMTMAGFMLHLSVAGMLMQPMREDDTEKEMKPMSKKYLGKEAREDGEEDDDDEEDEREEKEMSFVKSREEGEIDAAEDNDKKRGADAIDVSLLLDPVFSLVAVAFAITTPCVFGIWTYLPPFLKETGFGNNDAAMVMAVNSATAAVAAPVSGLLTTVKVVRPFVPAIAVAGALLTAVLDASVPFYAANLYPLVAYAAVAGFLGSANCFLRALTIQDMMEEEDDGDGHTTDGEGEGEGGGGGRRESNLTSVFGLFNFICGVGVVTLPIASGSLVDGFNSFKFTFFFHGLGQILAAVLLTGAILVKGRRRRRKRTSGKI